MRITIIQGAFFPVPPIMGGAVEKIWFRMGQEFARRGHAVTHISRAHPELPGTEIIEGVHHIRVAGYETPASLWKLKLLDLIYSRRACRAVPKDSDVVITNTFWSPMLLSRTLKLKTYVSVERMPKGQMRWYRKARLRANSTPVAAAIRQELPVSEHGRVSMIQNPLPFETNEPVEETTKPPALLYCGRVHPEKGLHLLIEAMRLVENPWPLRIVGPWQTGQGGGGEDYKAELLQLAQGLPVTFAGPIYQMESLNREYQSASVFIYPSVAEKGETFGLAPLEAMAWGCVPVVSDLDCFKDFIRDGENGIIFDHRDAAPAKRLSEALQIVMSDPARRHRLARQALAVRQTHSLSAIAGLFLEDFAKMTKA